jgi:hypothetical protein
MGSPSRDQESGTDIAGLPVLLKGEVKAMVPRMASR